MKEILESLWTNGSCMGSAFAGGVIGNLTASALWAPVPLALRKAGKTFQDLLTDEAGNIQNHDILRAITVAQCRATVDVIELCLLEDYGAGRSRANDLVQRARYLMPGLRIGSRGKEIKMLWRLRDALNDAVATARKTDPKELETIAFVFPEEAQDLAAAKSEATVVNYWEGEVAKAMTEALRDFLGESLPAPLSLRLQGGWFDYFRLGFRDELKTDQRAKVAYDLDVYEKVAALLGRSIADVQKLGSEVNQKFEKLETRLKEIRRTLDSLRSHVKNLTTQTKQSSAATDWNLLFQGVLIGPSVQPGLRGCKGREIGAADFQIYTTPSPPAQRPR